MAVQMYRHLMDVIQSRHNVSLQTLWRHIESHPHVWLACLQEARHDILLAADSFVVELDI